MILDRRAAALLRADSTSTTSASICAPAPTTPFQADGPPKHEDKPQAAKDAEASCTGIK
jgi:hypothetical protein